MINKGNDPVLFAFGVNHKTSPVEIREKLYLHESEVPCLLNEMRRTLSECVAISTCNRTEIFGVSPTADLDIDHYKELLVGFKKAGETVKN